MSALVWNRPALTWNSPPLTGRLGDFIWQKKWYFFEGWQRTASGWKRLYQAGPVLLDANEVRQQQGELFSQMKPYGAYDYADVYIWREAPGRGYHWESFTYRTAPGIPTEASQLPSEVLEEPATDEPADQPAGFPVPELTSLFEQLRTSITTGWDNARAAYNQSSKTLAELGTGFSAPETQYVLDAKQLAQVVTGFLDDALSGKRDVGYDVNGHLAIQGLVGDPLRVEDRNGVPTVVTQTGQVVPGSGTVGNPLVFLAIAGAVAINLGMIYAAISSIDVVKTFIHEKAVNKAMELGCNKPGAPPCTPEQITAMQTAIRSSQADLAKASSSSTALAGVADAAASIGKTALYVALGVAGIYLAVTLLPPMLASAGRKRELAAA